MKKPSTPFKQKAILTDDEIGALFFECCESLDSVCDCKMSHTATAQDVCSMPLRVFKSAARRRLKTK